MLFELFIAIFHNMLILNELNIFSEFTIPTRQVY